MRGKHTLVINGKVYDALTGLPVAAPDPVMSAADEKFHVASEKPRIVQITPTITHSVATSRTSVHAKQTHRTTQKSATLRRDVLVKPKPAAQVGAARRAPAAGHISRSPAISRFAPHPQPLTSRPKQNWTPRLDITPVRTAPAAIVQKKQALAENKPTLKAAPALSTRSLKEQLIAERLATVETTSAPKTSAHPRKRFFAKQPRLASLMAASLAIMVLGGYLTYLNMPGLSVRVAAAQADVAATYPDYHPDGYRFSGPVAYAPGQVAINFEANGGTTKYTVSEQKSTWDSQAVYDNVVAKEADDSYVTNSQQGLTIYTFKGEAAWVNKGILYTISGDAPLSNEQLLRIAASL